MDADTLVQVIAGVMTPLISLATYFSRRSRLRHSIRENLALIQELDKDDVLQQHTPAAMWLRGRVVLDVAKLTGQSGGVTKKPVPKGSVIFAGLLCAGFSFWTYYLNRNAFNWYSLITGVPAFLLAISIYGMFVDREIPPSDEPTRSGETSEETKGDPTPSKASSSESADP